MMAGAAGTLAIQTVKLIDNLVTGCGSKCLHNDWRRRDNRARTYGCYELRWSKSFWAGGRCYCCSCC